MVFFFAQYNSTPCPRPSPFTEPIDVNLHHQAFKSPLCLLSVCLCSKTTCGLFQLLQPKEDPGIVVFVLRSENQSDSIFEASLASLIAFKSSDLFWRDSVGTGTKSSHSYLSDSRPFRGNTKGAEVKEIWSQFLSSQKP